MKILHICEYLLVVYIIHVQGVPVAQEVTSAIEDQESSQVLSSSVVNPGNGDSTEAADNNDLGAIESPENAALEDISVMSTIDEEIAGDVLSSVEETFPEDLESAAAQEIPVGHDSDGHYVEKDLSSFDCGQDSETTCTTMDLHSDSEHSETHVDNAAFILKMSPKDVPEACVEDEGYGYTTSAAWVASNCGGSYEVCYIQGVCETVHLKSDFVRVEHYIDSQCNIRFMTVASQISPAFCALGRSFGFHQNMVWADDGCEAVFNVCHG